MSEINYDELRAKLGLGKVDDLAKTVEAINARETKRELEAIQKEQAAKELERMQALVDKATGSQKEELKRALETITKLEEASKQHAEVFVKEIKDLSDTIEAQKKDIKQLLAARTNGISNIAGNIHTALFGDQKAFEKEVEAVVMLGYITRKGIFDTEYGKAHREKAVNSSSSIEVSSESYETIFSTNILRDIQAKLVLGDMFEELPMSAKQITFPIEPEASEATWVDITNYGTDNSTGAEYKMKLTEVTFRTFKLAAKAFMTDETNEDVILTLLPIIRRHLVEAHAKSIEKAFMNGTGVGQPLGLLAMARADGTAVATAATTDGATLVTGLEISKLRRKLGRHGTDINKLVLVVSLDAYYDLLEDEEFKDVAQVEAANAIKLQGQVGRIYGMPVLVSEYFPAKAASAEFCFIAYRDNFVIPRQRTITVEAERQAEKQRDAYYVTQRVGLARLIDKVGIVSGTYAA